jgi:uncharacterized protein
MRIIDAHTHPVLFNEGQGQAAADALVARARTFGIERLVALGDVLRHGRSPTAKQLREINDETAQLLRWHPKVFVGFCYLNPTLGEKAVRQEVERTLALGFRGLKLELANNARDACMRPLMKLAEQHDLPVLQHSWSQTNIRERRFHSDPADTAQLAARYPQVRIIMAHLTGCGVRGVLEAKPYDNLVLDTSGGAPEAGLVEFAVEQLGADRVMYGSDWPIRDFPVGVARITGSAVGAADRRKILYDNAREWLRLDEPV